MLQSARQSSVLAFSTWIHQSSLHVRQQDMDHQTPMGKRRPLHLRPSQRSDTKERAISGAHDLWPRSFANFRQNVSNNVFIDGALFRGWLEYGQ